VEGRDRPPRGIRPPARPWWELFDSLRSLIIERGEPFFCRGLQKSCRVTGRVPWPRRFSVAMFGRAPSAGRHPDASSGWHGHAVVGVTMLRRRSDTAATPDNAAAHNLPGRLIFPCPTRTKAVSSFARGSSNDFECASRANPKRCVVSRPGGMATSRCIGIGVAMSRRRIDKPVGRSRACPRLCLLCRTGRGWSGGLRGGWRWRGRLFRLYRPPARIDRARRKRAGKPCPSYETCPRLCLLSRSRSGIVGRGGVGRGATTVPVVCTRRRQESTDHGENARASRPALRD
jgi:hypothetical protein